MVAVVGGEGISNHQAAINIQGKLEEEPNQGRTYFTPRYNGNHLATQLLNNPHKFTFQCDGPVFRRASETLYNKRDHVIGQATPGSRV